MYRKMESYDAQVRLECPEIQKNEPNMQLRPPILENSEVQRTKKTHKN